MCMIFNLYPLCQFLVFEARKKRENKRSCVSFVSSTFLSLTPEILPGTTEKAPFSEQKLSRILFVAELCEGLIYLFNTDLRYTRRVYFLPGFSLNLRPTIKFMQRLNPVTF